MEQGLINTIKFCFSTFQTAKNFNCYIDKFAMYNILKYCSIQPEPLQKFLDLPHCAIHCFAKFGNLRV